MSRDLEYYRTREAQERAAAAEAADNNLRALHLDFARRYMKLADVLEQVQPTRERVV
jgi:hypothetical protein